MLKLKAGDVLGCSGRSWTSGAINLITMGLPWYSLSHVAIVGHYHGQLALFESTMGCKLPCLDAGREVCGVQVHGIGERIDSYDGSMWHYPLSTPLDGVESHRLSAFLRRWLGAAYDEIGALRSTDWTWWESLLRPTNLTSLFCSEYACAAHCHIHRFNTGNVSRWSPNRWMRAELRQGVVQTPGRIK